MINKNRLNRSSEAIVVTGCFLLLSMVFAGMKPVLADNDNSVISKEVNSTEDPTSASKSEKTPVNIQVSNGVTYDKTQKAWVFIGDAKVTYKGDSISADRIILPDEGSYLIAEGNVVLKRENQELHGQVVNYNLNTREGKITMANARVTGDGIKGNVIIKGNEIGGSSDHYSLSGGELTSCDLENPHYHIEAKSIEVWANEKMVIKGVSYYEGRVRLFYWPYFVMPLKDENAFTLPSIGYSSLEGVYIKTTYNYYRNENLKGKYHFDLFQKSRIGPGFGIGVGVDNTFKIKPFNADGSANVYFLLNPALRKVEASSSLKYHQPLFFGWDSSINVVGSGVNDPQQGTFKTNYSSLISLNKKGSKYSGDLKVNHIYPNNSDKPVETRLTTQHSIALNKTASINLDGSYVEKNDGTIKSASTYRVEIKDATPQRSLSLITDRSFNPDELNGTGQDANWNKIERLPEFTAQYSDIGLPKSFGKLKIPPMGATLTAGKYREDDNKEASKADVQLGFRDYGINLTKSTRIDVTGLAKGTIYSTDDKRLGVVSGAKVNQALPGGSSLSLGYLYEDKVGDESPFKFDSWNKSETLSGGMNLKAGAFKSTINGSYNFNVSPSLGDVIGSVDYKPNEKLSIGAEGRFNPNNMVWRLASSSVRLKPSDNVSVDGTVKYNFDKSRFEAFDAKADLKIFKDIRLGYTGQYDNVLGKVTRNDISVGYHLHCREIRVTYRQATDRSVWLEYRLDAFPGTDVKVGGSDSSGLALDVNGLDNILK